MPPRAEAVQKRVELLVAHFDECLVAFNAHPPFNKEGQLEYHQRTISRRRVWPSAVAALQDDVFLHLLYKTLHAWGLGGRASVLRPYSDFVLAINKQSDNISSIERLTIDDPKLDVDALAQKLWQIISSLDIVANDAKLVAGSKTLHHLLPEMVVPIDRKYTGRFLQRHGPDFQYRQPQVLSIAFHAFATIASATNPGQYVGPAWATSRSKVIDNAIVGFLLPN